MLLGCDAVNGNNFSKWCYKPFDDLIKKARADANVGNRTKLYEQAQVVAAQQTPQSNIAHSMVNQPMRKEVSGFKVSPFGLNSFYGVAVN